MATLSVTSTGTSYLTVTISGLDSSYAYQRDYYWYIDGVEDGDTSTEAYVSSTKYTYSGLDEGTKYTLTVYIYGWDQGYQKYITSLSTTGTTSETMPSEDSAAIDSADISASGLTVSVEVTVTCDANFSGSYYIVAYDSGDNRMDYAGSYSSSKTVTLSWTESSAGTYRYYIYVSPSRSSTSSYYDYTTVRITLTSTVTRKYFNWDRSALVSSAPSDDYPISSGDAISTYLTATKWTLLQSAVNNVEAALGDSETSFTSVSSGDTMTATIFNEVRKAIRSAGDSTSRALLCDAVSSGDTLTAAQFNSLQASLNAIEV